MIKVSFKGQPTIVADQISQLEINEISYNFASLKVKVSNRRVHENKYLTFYISIIKKCSAGHTQNDRVVPKNVVTLLIYFQLSQTS